MILAAGYGTRLQPYSLIKPKPLFPVLNRPLLLATIQRLKHAGFDRIVVNCHHLAGQIAEAVDGIAGVHLQEELAILGTGGSLAEALGRLRDEPLLVSNGDIYHTIDFRQLYDSHRQDGREVTLALHDSRRFNKVSLANGRISGFDGPAGGTGVLAFTGVQVINPEVLAAIGTRRPFCIIDHYRELIKAGRTIDYRIEQQSNWTDIGTPRDYLRLHGELLTGRKPVWPELDYQGSEPVLIDSQARCDPACRIQPWSCIGKARIEAGAVISRSVIWDGAVVGRDVVVTERIVAPL